MGNHLFNSSLTMKSNIMRPTCQIPIIRPQIIKLKNPLHLIGRIHHFKEKIKEISNYAIQ
jgi:hypothetical protein